MYPEQNNLISKQPRDHFLWFVVALIIALTLGVALVWALMSKSSVKKELEQQVSQASTIARQELTEELTTQFEEAAKKPYRTINTLESLGGVSIEVAKSWSAFVKQSDRGTSLLEFQAHPNFVPDESSGIGRAVVMEVVNRPYDNQLNTYNSRIRNGRLSSSAIRVNGVLGVKLTGEIDSNKNGVLVLLPLRDKTIKIWNEASRYSADFEKALFSLKFQP